MMHYGDSSRIEQFNQKLIRITDELGSRRVNSATVQIRLLQITCPYSISTFSTSLFLKKKRLRSLRRFSCRLNCPGISDFQ